MCGGHRKKRPAEDEDIDADSDTGQSAADMVQQHSILLSALRAPTDPVLLSDLGPVMPIVVYTGPTRTQAEIATLQALPEAAETAAKKKGKAKTAAKPTDTKSAAVKPAEPRPRSETGRRQANDGQTRSQESRQRPASPRPPTSKRHPRPRAGIAA